MLLRKINSYPNLKAGAAHRGAMVFVYEVTGTEEEMKSYKDIKGNFHRVDEETGKVLFFSSEIPAGVNADGTQRTYQKGDLGATATLEVVKNGKGEPALRTVLTEQTKMRNEIIAGAIDKLAMFMLGGAEVSAPAGVKEKETSTAGEAGKL